MGPLARLREDDQLPLALACSRDLEMLRGDNMILFFFSQVHYIVC